MAARTRRRGARCSPSSAAALAAGPGTSRCCRRCRRGGRVPLGEASGASARMALTSRNCLLFARRAIAARNPDLLAANGGGCNAILVRGGRSASTARAS